MKKLTFSPLVLVLSQVRFSPILEIEKHITSIQGQLKKKGLPLFEEESSQEVTLIQAGSPPEIKARRRWIFTDIARHNSVILSQDFLALETSSYDQFPVFRERFESYLNVIAGSLELDAIERVGLRYVDVVRTREGKAARDLIRAELRGLQLEDANQGRFTQFGSMSQAVTDFGKLNVRVIHSDEGISLPPDLAGTKLQIQDLPPKGEAVSILDIDHFSVVTRSFDVRAILEALDALHVITDLAFQRVVTPEAIQLWS